MIGEVSPVGHALNLERVGPEEEQSELDEPKSGDIVEQDVEEDVEEVPEGNRVEVPV